MATIPLLLILIHSLLLMLQGEVINIVTIDEHASLTCQPNSSIEFTWSVTTSQGVRIVIFRCDGTVNSQCEGAPFLLPDSDFTASWNGNLSVLSFLKPVLPLETFSCEQSGEELRTYNVTFANPDDITDPSCNVAASSQNEDLQVTLSCETTISQWELLDAVFRIEGTGTAKSSKSLHSPNINENLDYDTFLNITNAVCVLSVSGTQTSLNRSCQYPKAVNIEQTIEGNDIAIRCDVESNTEVTWIVYESDGSKIDITNTSWTRDGGRSLLIRGVSSNHHGNKVVECRNYRDGSKSMIGYTTISTLVNENTDDKVPLIPTPGSNNDVFFVPALLFLTLWLITTTLCGVWLGCRPRGSHDVSTIPRTSDDEQTQTPEYATVILSTSGGNDLDIQGSSSGGLGLAGEKPEGERKKSSRKESKEHYINMSGNHGPTEYETMKSVTYKSPRAENYDVPEGSSQVDSGSADGIAMVKGPVRLEGSKAYYMDMSGNHGHTDSEAMKSLNYANV